MEWKLRVLSLIKIDAALLFLLVISTLSAGIVAVPIVSSPDEPLWVETNGPPGGSFGLIEFNPGNPDIMYAGSGF